MGELTVIEKKAIEDLPVHIQPLVQARFGQPIKAYSDMNLAENIADIITIAFTELGINLEKKHETITFLRETLMRDFKAPKFQPLSLQLIKLFISNGIRGQYSTFKNQMNTINIQNIHHWINEGLKSEDYKRSVTEYNKKVSEMEYKPKIYDLMTSKKAIVDAFERYKVSKDVPFTAAAYYDILNDLLGVEYKGKKTLVADPEIRKSIVLKCESDLESEFRPLKDKAEKRGDFNTAESISRALAGEGKTLENRIRKAFLVHYFDQLIKEGKDLVL